MILDMIDDKWCSSAIYCADTVPKYINFLINPKICFVFPGICIIFPFLSRVIGAAWNSDGIAYTAFFARKLLRSGSLSLSRDLRMILFDSATWCNKHIIIYSYTLTSLKHDWSEWPNSAVRIELPRSACHQGSGNGALCAHNAPTQCL